VLQNDNRLNAVEFFGKLKVIKKRLMPVLLPAHDSPQRRSGENHMIIPSLKTGASHDSCDLFKKAEVHAGQQKHFRFTQVFQLRGEINQMHVIISH
jgi:hypothetical protein